MVTTRWRQRSRTSKGCFERSTRPMPVGTGYYTCFFWWHSFARLQDVSNVSSSAPVQGRALKAEEYLMPVAQVWKNLKHRDGTIYLAYRTLKNFSWVFYWQRLNVLEWYRMSQPNCIVFCIVIRKWKRKCPSSNEHQLSAPDWVICMIRYAFEL